MNSGLAQCSTGGSRVCLRKLGIFESNNVQIPFICLMVFRLFSFSDSDFFGDDKKISDSEIVLS